VLGLQPRNIAALVNRASLRKQLGDIDGALTDYASVLDVDPRNATALYNRSVMHVAAGDYEAAVNDLDRLIDAHPAVTAAHTLRTECLDHLRRHRNFLNETERENI
jgi:tetratricopeptide (TPR) repeat protein